MAEEFDSIGPFFIFVSHSVRRCDKDSVGDCMRALRGLPRFELALAEFFFLGRVPANCSWIKQYLGAKERRDSRSFRIPLIPADQDSDLCVLRIPHAKPAGSLVLSIVRDIGVAWCEIIFLVEERIIRDVHLPVHAEEFSVGVDDSCGIAIDTGGLSLENGNDQNHVQLLRDLLHSLDRWSWNWLGDVEALALLRFAEVGSVEELLQADDLGTAGGSFPNAVSRAVDVGVGVGGHSLLDQSDSYWCGHRDAKADTFMLTQEVGRPHHWYT